MGNIFVMQELPVIQDYDYQVSFVEGDYQSLDQVMNKSSTAKERLHNKSQSVDKSSSSKKIKFEEEVQRNRLKKLKTTLNKEKYIQVDETIDKNVFSTSDIKIFCAITGSKVRELTNYGIFRSRVIIFQIRTKMQIGAKKKSYKVRR